MVQGYVCFCFFELGPFTVFLAQYPWNPPGGYVGLWEFRTSLFDEANDTSVDNSNATGHYRITTISL